MNARLPLRFLAIASLAAAVAAPVRAGAEYPDMGPDIYDVHADGNAQISAALIQASAEHKRVLLVFGANWCIWCHRLHSTIESDATVSRILRDHFVVVDVDVNTRNGVRRNADVVTRYGSPTKLGIPVLVVLDPDGKQLCTKDSGELEEGHGHSPAKIAAFLNLWVPAAR